jgi:vanillate O-demethylase monooxygenase subunit
MFVRNCWYVAAWGHELGDAAPISRMIIDEAVVLYRTGAGAVVALEDRCCHRFAPLSKGRVEGDDLRCMYHGLKFNPAGTCIEIPGQDEIPPRARVRAYPVVERHSWIWVWMGDPDLADPALIPAAVGLDDPAWTLRAGQMDYEADYLLINDNLTDFSHLSFVHRNSFGASEAWARQRPGIGRLDRGIRVQRWMSGGLRNDTERPAHVRVVGETWQSYDYLAPGVLLMRTATFPFGTMALVDGAPPGPELRPLSENFTSQAVTPMTGSTSRYFFSWGPRAGEGSAAQADAMMGVALKAFEEDRQIIEAQQKVIRAHPGGRGIMTSADAGPMQMRAVLERLIKAEQGAPAQAAGR